MADGFRATVRSGRPLLGVFIKTASHQVVELISLTGLDFAIIDAEHAPFDLATLDRMALAGRAGGLPLLIRPPTAEPGFIGQCLDLGLGGIVAPHIDSPAAAESLVGAVRYDRGHRGFSPSTRAGGFGAPDARAYREAADSANSVWCQIEDAAALGRLEAICGVDEVDCLFVGRADLAASLGVDRQDDPAVVSAVRTVAAVGRRHGRATGIFIGAPTEIPALRTLGYSVFVCGADQGWLKAEGRRIRGEADAAFRGGG